MPARTFKFGHLVGLVQTQIEAGSALPLESLFEKGLSSDSDYLVRWTYYAQAWSIVKYLVEDHADGWRSMWMGRGSDSAWTDASASTSR